MIAYLAGALTVALLLGMLLCVSTARSGADDYKRCRGLDHAQ